MRRTACGFFGILVAAALSATPALAASQCSMDAIKAIAPHGAVIDSVTTGDNGAPHCQVDGHIITTNPGPNTVAFRLLLPDSGWNNRYIVIAMGGNAGVFPDNPKLYTKAEVDRLLGLGWAVAATDTGHKVQEGFAFFRDPVKKLDFHDRAIHVTAVATETITKKFYDARKKMYRYLIGCSGGGSAGLNSGLDHPTDFDGVVSGAPGLGGTSMLGYAWDVLQTVKDPTSWVSPAKLMHVEDAVIAKCDMSDGAKDDMVWDPKKCNFDPDELICKGADSDACLTPGQAKIIKNIIAGPSNSRGQIYPGTPPTNTSAWPPSLTGPMPPPWSDKDPNRQFHSYIYAAAFTKLAFGDKFNFETQLDFSDPTLLDRWNASFQKDQSNLQAADRKPWMPDSWLKHGPKLILWHGIGDPNVSYEDTVNFWKRGFTESSSPKAYAAKTRMYVAPGVTHCGGGTGPTDVPQRMLDAMTAWVEVGKAPAAIVTHRVPNANVRPHQTVPNPKWKDLPPREFLLCPQPERSVFVGKPGEEMSASRWTCKPPV